jgi:hypothetical protein
MAGKTSEFLLLWAALYEEGPKVQYKSPNRWRGY